MLEYGIKAITTNPTIITKAKEIIKLIDSRTKKTRAFVLPAEYAPYIEKIVKEIEYKKWVEEKKKLLKNSKIDNSLEGFSKVGRESINEYLGND
jgi:transaldolase